MVPCFAIDDIITPKKFLLSGLWYGPKRAKRAVIFVHGLGGSMWSRSTVLRQLADPRTAVLTFNNRGHDKVAFIARAGKNHHTDTPGGAAHEVFTDCIDDIEGAINFVRKQGIKDIFLIGHSTGCQKSIYWASRKGGRGVKGIVLLAPVSDYAAALKHDRRGKLARLTKIARTLVRAGKPHAFMPGSILNDGSLNDAQRFLSLNTPDSAETIFPYEQKGKRPQTLQKVTRPILVLWAGADEYADRPAEEIANWFDRNIKSAHRVVVIPKALHSFKGAKRRVVGAIRKFMDA